MDKICCVCGNKATVEDTEYDEFYCINDAKDYQVFEGPYRMLDE